MEKLIGLDFDSSNRFKDRLKDLNILIVRNLLYVVLGEGKEKELDLFDLLCVLYDEELDNINLLS